MSYGDESNLPPGASLRMLEDDWYDWTGDDVAYLCEFCAQEVTVEDDGLPSDGLCAGCRAKVEALHDGPRD